MLSKPSLGKHGGRCLALLAGLLLLATQASAATLAEGRAKLLSLQASNVLEAYDILHQLNATAPTDEVRLYLALATLGHNLLASQGVPAASTLPGVAAEYGLVLGRLNEAGQVDPSLAGVSVSSLRLLPSPVLFPNPDDYTVPTDAPTGEAVRSYLEHGLFGAVYAAQSLLAGIAPGFTAVVPAADFGGESDVEIDMGDVLLLRSALAAVQTWLLIQTAHDHDVNFAQLPQGETFGEFFGRLLQQYPSLLSKLTAGVDGSTLIAAAKDALIAFGTLYDQASDYLRGDTSSTGGTEELFSILGDPEAMQAEAEFRAVVDDLVASARDSQVMHPSNDPKADLNLGAWFTAKPGLRAMLPALDAHALPKLGTMGSGLGNNPTLGGLFPNMTQNDWPWFINGLFGQYSGLSAAGRLNGGVDFWDGRKVAMAGRVAYVGDSTSGDNHRLLVIDAAAPWAPVVTAAITLDDYVSGVAASGNRLLVITAASLRLYSLADPRHPALLGSIAVSSWNSQVAIEGATAYVFANSELRAYDISGQNLSLTGSVSAQYWVGDMAVLNGYAYLLGTGDIITVDTHAWTVGTTPANTYGLGVRAVNGRLLLLADQTWVTGKPLYGLAAFDLTQPAQPQQTSFMSLDDRAVFLAAGDGLLSLQYDPEESPDFDESAGLAFYNASEGGEPEYIGAVKHLDEGQTAFSQGVAVHATWDSITIVDLSSLTSEGDASVVTIIPLLLMQ